MATAEAESNIVRSEGEHGRRDMMDIRAEVKSLAQEGAYLFAAGNAADAAEKFRRAVALHPDSPDLRHNLASTLARAGRIEESLRHYRRSLELRPNSYDTCRNAALALAKTQRWQEAEELYRRAIGIGSDKSSLARCELGVLLRLRKRLPESASELELALKMSPQSTEASHQLAVTYAAMQRYDEATTVLEQALSQRPDLPAHLAVLGNVNEQQGRYEAAARAYRESLRYRPQSPEVINDLGVVLAAQGDYEQAIKCYESALELLPGKAWILNNLGNALRSHGDLERSLAALQDAVRAKPDYAEAHNNLGITWMQKGMPLAAIEEYERALYFSPDYSAPHLNRSLAYLTLADFEKGLVEYEWRWKGPLSKSPRFKQPRWYGESLAGETILLHAEQGLGDTLQFIRYAQLVKERGARVVAQIQKPLIPLLSRCPWIDRVVAAKESVPESFRTHASLLSLPGIFRTKLDTIPAEIPYLSADPALVQKWKERLKPHKGFKVGIAWQGNPGYKGDRQRSVPLSYFSRLAKIADVQLISVQKGHGTEQIAAVTDRFPLIQLDPFDEESGPFMDTAAILKNLDLLICSDSAIVHLAGALGVPTWLALPFNPDWRWFRNRDDSPWYPSMRLFRQPTSDDWESTFRQIATALADLVLERQSPATERCPAATSTCTDLMKRIEVLFRDDKIADCIELCRQLLELQPDSAVAHQNLGALLATAKRWSEAESHLKKATEISPRFVDAYGNLGLVRFQADRFHEALDAFQAGLNCGGASAAVHNNVGMTLMELGRPEEALEAYDRAVELDPGFVDAHLNRAHALLCLGDYRQGWLELEWRWKRKDIVGPKGKASRWTGESPSGKSILLHAETQDEETIRLIRYAASLKSLGAHIVASVPRRLMRFVAGCAGIDEVVDCAESPRQTDFQVSLSSLPWILGTTLSTVPSPTVRIGSPLAAHGKQLTDYVLPLKVVVGGGAIGRSEELNVAWLSSQLRAAGIEAFEAKSQFNERDVANSPAGLDESFDYFELAKSLWDSDLVVAVDSPTSHLAASMGIPTILVLGDSSSSRWLHGRADSPWYPSVAILRRAGNSASTFHQHILREVTERVELHDR